MADMLKFYKGLEAGLPAAGANGAIYITTDEGGIYLGTGTGMKRLGDFVQVDKVSSLPAKAHENCLYYCVAENILAKWNGTEWKQVNKQPTTEELKTLLGLGSMAYKSEVAEGDLSAELAEKVNAASEGNHAHANKGVLDGITAEKVAAWDAAEGNAKTYADGLDAAMDARVDVLEAKFGEGEGTVAAQITSAIEALDFTDTAVDGEYVSAVNEVDGKISVIRKALPDYSETYDAKGAANTALENAKAYADGLAANYDSKGSAAAVQTKLDEEVARAKAAEQANAAAAGAAQAAAEANADAISAIKDDENIDSFADVVAELAKKQDAGDYATKAEAQAMADGKDNAIAEAKKAGTDAQGTIDAYITSNDTALAGVKAIAEQGVADAAEVAGDLAGHIAEAEGKYETKTDAAAKLTEAKGYTDAEVAKVQGEVDALEGYVGTIPEGATAQNIVAYVQEKTSGIATSENLAELTGRVAQAETDIDNIEKDYLKAADKTELQGNIDGVSGRIAAIEADYLKAADKTELSNAIAAEKTRAEAAEGALDARLIPIETFLEAAELDTDEGNVIDTLKEIQEYIKSDESGASAMAASIQQNTVAIAAEETRAKAAEEANAAAAKDAQDAADAAQGAVDALSETHATDKAALEAAIGAKAAQTDLDNAVGRIGAAEGEIDTLQSEMDVVEGKVEALETASATHALKTEVEAVQTALDEYKESNDDALELKANAADVYAKGETYSKTEVDNAIATATEWGSF